MIRTILTWFWYVLYLLGVLIACLVLLVVLVGISEMAWPDNALARVGAFLLSFVTGCVAAGVGYSRIVTKRRDEHRRAERFSTGRKSRSTTRMERPGKRSLDELYEDTFLATGRGDLSDFRVEVRANLFELPRDRRWSGGEPVTVGGIRIERPLVYVSEGAREECPGTLCRAAPVSKDGEVFDEELNYWPSYAELSPRGRRGLLLWLADGARTDSVTISYAFLYFYGLEQRGVGDEADLGAVRDEVLRLHGLFGQNRSFHGYACGLVGATHALEDSDPTASLERLAPRSHKKLPLAFLESISACWPGRTWPAAYVLELLKHEASNTVVHKRTWAQFEELFLLRFVEQFPEGLQPRNNARPGRLRYHWAANTGTVHRELGILGTGSFGARWNRALGLWADVTAELKPYALAAGRKALSESALYAHLPDELKAGEHPEQAAWQSWFEARADDHERCLATWGELVELSASLDPSGGKVTPKQCREVAALCDSVGLAMEPDPRAGRGASRKLSDELLVYRPASGQATPPDEYHDALSLMVEVCVGVAAADGEIGEDEIERVLDHIDRDNALGEAERERLLASVAFFHATGGGLARATRARLGKLPQAVRDSLARLTVLVALADDEISVEEEKALRKVYRALNVAPSELDAVLHARTAGIEEIDEVAKAHVAIDWDRVRAITADTREVQSILHQALTSEVEHEESAPEPAAVEVQVLAVPTVERSTTGPQSGQHAEASLPGLEVIEGLDEPLRALVAWIRDRAGQDLPARDWDEMCKAQGLMAAVAIERINDWADDALGDYLIEGDGPYTVHAGLLERALPADGS